MNAANVEQLLIECHPEWTGFSSELVRAAVRSSLGRRALLNRLAPRFSTLRCVNRTPQDLSGSEGFARLHSAFWLPAGALMSRLITLGACFYQQQICAEIRRSQVAEWKATLGTEHYRLVIKDVRACLGDNLSLPKAQLDPLGFEALSRQAPELRQITLASYGLHTMLSVAKALAPDGDIFEETSMRLGSLFPPDQLTHWLDVGRPANEALCDHIVCVLALWQTESSMRLKA